MFNLFHKNSPWSNNYKFHAINTMLNDYLCSTEKQDINNNVVTLFGRDISICKMKTFFSYKGFIMLSLLMHPFCLKTA